MAPGSDETQARDPKDNNLPKIEKHGPTFGPVLLRQGEPGVSQYDSVFGKRVLTYWENMVTPDYNQMNGFMVGIDNYIYLFLERGKPHLSKNV